MAGPFELSIRKWTEEQGEKADEEVKNLLMDIYGRLISRSPVDTGRFRANWQYSLGEIRPGLVLVYGTTENPAPPPETPFIRPGAHKVVHVFHNNLPYARRLEYGYSDQAPEGIIRRTLLDFEGIADKGGANT